MMQKKRFLSNVFSSIAKTATVANSVLSGVCVCVCGYINESHP